MPLGPEPAGCSLTERAMTHAAKYGAHQFLVLIQTHIANDGSARTSCAKPLRYHGERKVVAPGTLNKAEREVVLLKANVLKISGCISTE